MHGGSGTVAADELDVVPVHAADGPGDAVISTIGAKHDNPAAIAARVCADADHIAIIRAGGQVGVHGPRTLYQYLRPDIGIGGGHGGAVGFPGSHGGGYLVHGMIPIFASCPSRAGDVVHAVNLVGVICAGI